MMVAFVSTDNSMDKQDIADYIVSNLQDPLSRINGVGSMDVYGSQYAMRIWLDPNKLNSYQLTTQTWSRPFSRRTPRWRSASWAARRRSINRR